MPTDAIKAGIRGHVTVWRVYEKTGLKTPVFEKANQIQVSWGHIAAKQLGFRAQADRDSYAISGLYFEFENQTDPNDVVTTEAFPRTLNFEYYASLASTSNRDYVRVPLRLEPTLSISPTSEGATVLYLNNLSNQLTFFGQTAGTTGVHGKPFSSAANSKVFAAALVATPKFDDASRDVLFARIVFENQNQIGKEASAQIGLTWDIAFE